MDGRVAPDPRRRGHVLRVTAGLAVVLAAVLVGACGTSAGSDRGAPGAERPAGVAGRATEVRAGTQAFPRRTLSPGLVRVAVPVVPRLAVHAAAGSDEVTHRLAQPTEIAGTKVDLVLLVIDASGDGQWLEVLLPVRPNGSSGWVEARDVRVTRHAWRIQVSLSEFRIRVRQGDTTVLDAPIGEADGDTPTPVGLYYTTVLFRPPDADGPYGPFAYGLSGYSDALRSFGGGPGQLGLHGTDDPSSIGRRASHGCIRLRNEDIAFLAERLPLGVPVEVVA